ncbi:MAG: 3-methyl-2-oxobutanoate hydroxymethyltransferase [Epsilonproteobacteria bacterium]|nr:MAG: 3-methyl-2-oxobutanoate hydroxymethyltransferase [Campylobacterota bacterium]RLA66720.1 MAG: 3-methyl-2-oxobutanoate hydroxymethyltransferase [Campylobacterota bacterium]
MKKLNTRIIKKHKLKGLGYPLSMLTCYDYQTAQMLDETELDLILVGDSVGNVILGYETTIKVSLEEMVMFSSAVKRGAPNKFVVADLPFGTYSSLEEGIANSKTLFQQSECEAVKLEGAFPYQLELINRLVQIGIPVMGHIGLTPQSVHEQGGYYMHGKDQRTAHDLISKARDLQAAGVFAIVLECVTPSLAQQITDQLDIPTVGIGSGDKTDGQVLVINDLLKMGKETPPNFCNPMADFYSLRQGVVQKYLKNFQKTEKNENHLYH